MFKVIGHRGVPALAPENTLASFAKVAAVGGQWIETDVGITQDKQVFILHDDYLDRTTNGSGALTDQKAATVAQLSAGAWFGAQFADQRVPRLQQLIETVNKYHLNLNLELKAVIGPHANELADELVRQVAAALRQVSADVRVIVSSFNPIMLLKLKQIAPEIERAVLFEDHTFYEDWTLIMQACGAKIIHPQSEHLTRQQVEQMKAYGYEVNVWTVNDVSSANELKNWGADGVFTDNVGTMVQLQTSAKQED